MGTKKVLIFDKDQLAKEDHETIESLQQGLAKIDSLPIPAPEKRWFEQLVLAEQQKIRKNLFRDLTLFLIMAFFILGGMMFSLYQQPAVFAFLQISVTIFLILYTSVQFARKVKLHGK